MSAQLRRRSVALAVAGLLAASTAFIGCKPEDPVGIGKFADRIDVARSAIEAQSAAWRDQLQKLSDDLNALESQVSKDAKEIATSTTNQVADLSTQAIQLTDAKVQDRIAQAGTEFRCNTDFLKHSVTTELQRLVDHLKFWEKDKNSKYVPPVHGNCWVTPSVLSLYPTDNGNWSVDSANMSDKGVIHLFGYAYRSEALPTVTLQTQSGSVVRAATVKPAYVTRYQVNLDISTETFAGVQPGSRLVLDWPDDRADRTTISLVPRPPAKLQIQTATFSNTAPRAERDPVKLSVTVKNTGGSPSGAFVVTWVADPVLGSTYSQQVPALRANESTTTPLSLGPHVYKRSGDIDSTVAISAGGGDSKFLRLRVLAPPPPTHGTLYTTDDCDAIDYNVEHAHPAVPAGQVEFRLEPGGTVNWWKAIFVPVTRGSDVESRSIPFLGPVLVSSADGKAVLNGGGLTGGYRMFQMENGSKAGGLIALADLDGTRELGFGKAKGLGNKTTLAFRWDALSTDVIDPLEGSRVTLTWKKDAPPC